MLRYIPGKTRVKTEFFKGITFGDIIVAIVCLVFAIVIIARELLVSALRQLAASKNVIIAADMWGKVKANFQYVALTLYMIFGYFIHIAVLPGWAMTTLEVLCWVSMIATVFSTVMSGVHYMVKNKAVFVDNAKEEAKEKTVEYEQDENFGN